MEYTQGQVPMQYTQPEAIERLDHSHQTPRATQQTQHPQLGMSYCNQKQQVQSLNQYTVHSDYAQPIVHQQYTSNFPALPEQPEFQWQKVEHKKRPRDVPETQTPNVKQLKLHDCWLHPPPPQTTNKSDVLTEEGQDDGRDRPNSKLPKPPPIFIAGVQNIKPLKELLVTVSGNDFELKVLNGNQVKVLPKTVDKYRAIIHALIEKHTEFHTYQLKEDRCFRTVLRGMHYSTDVEDIKLAIEQHGHTVTNVYIKQTWTYIPVIIFRGPKTECK